MVFVSEREGEGGRGWRGARARDREADVHADKRDRNTQERDIIF